MTPGFVATEQSTQHYGDAATVAARRRDRAAAAAWATPDDVAQACLFLASPGATYVSGTCLTVHGGGAPREPPAFLSAGVGSDFIEHVLL